MNDIVWFIDLKQQILKKYFDAKEKNANERNDITMELKRIGDALDTDAPHHLVGLIYYYGIGIQSDTKRAIEYFRKGADSMLWESLVWLMMIYLKDDPQNGIISNIKNVGDYYNQLGQIYNTEISQYYRPYIIFARMVKACKDGDYDRKLTDKLYTELRTKYSKNLELQLLLNEFETHCKSDENKIEEGVSDRTESDIFNPNNQRKLKTVCRNEPSIFTSRGNK